MIYENKTIEHTIFEDTEFMREQTLTECELLVMRVIWQSEEPLSLQDITDRVNTLYKREWKSQTVSVFLGRIVQKGFLTNKRQGRLFFYYPTIAEEEYEKDEIAKCVDFWSGGRADIFLASLAKARDITDFEKQELRKLLDDLD